MTGRCVGNVAGAILPLRIVYDKPVKEERSIMYEV